MIFVDLNLLIYAVNRDAPHHDRARSWIAKTLASDEPFGLCWPVLLGFIRITTQPRILTQPLALDQAVQVVDGWMSCPNVVIVEPGPHHWRILRTLLQKSTARGNLTTDAHLAAMAIERGMELCTSDRDFARFPGLSWRNPLDAS